ncbi:MAG: Uncharacterised protein [Marinobacterium sp. xm-d-530]|jgi:prophage regulatory protein|nr:MAG: Uncharacterised protein [Marinobacterium sp. xm-d-530]
MSIRLLRASEVTALVGLSRPTIYRQMAEGKFPKSISLGGRIVAWDSSDIEQWIADRISEAKSSQSMA